MKIPSVFLQRETGTLLSEALKKGEKVEVCFRLPRVQNAAIAYHGVLVHSLLLLMLKPGEWEAIIDNLSSGKTIICLAESLQSYTKITILLFRDICAFFIWKIESTRVHLQLIFAQYILNRLLNQKACFLHFFKN